jgi:hypothetical protein
MEGDLSIHDSAADEEQFGAGMRKLVRGVFDAESCQERLIPYFKSAVSTSVITAGVGQKMGHEALRSPAAEAGRGRASAVVESVDA